MSAQIDEGNLRFDFGDEWTVERYDGDEKGQPSHAFYRNNVASLPNTKAVDFIGVVAPDDTYLIEVKDFRGYRVQNKKRLKSSELALEVAYKVRDSIAGIVGASRNEPAPTVLSRAAKLIINREKTVKIVLWLEDDAAVSRKEWAAELNTLTTKIQSNLGWFTARVLVVSQSTHANKPPHLRVGNVPGTRSA